MFKGDVEEARLIFDRCERNIIASNSMIVLLGKMGQVMEAWKLFNEMDEKIWFLGAKALFDVMPRRILCHGLPLIKARARKASGNNTNDNEAKEREPENIMAAKRADK
ncbi:hypothetical protein AAG906_025157 [Vitis piasezkii]